MKTLDLKAILAQINYRNEYKTQFDKFKEFVESDNYEMAVATLLSGFNWCGVHDLLPDSFIEKYTGIKIRWHNNGRLAFKSNFLKGKFNGKCELYFENGQRQQMATYKDGVLDGKYNEWYFLPA